MTEYKIYGSSKTQLIIGLLLFAICIFIGLTMLFFNNHSIIHLFTGSMNLIFAIFIGIYTYKKIKNKTPELILNELGVFIKGTDKLYPWAIIGRIEFKSFEQESEIMYKNYLQIQLFDEQKELSIPYDDLEMTKEQIILILQKFKDANDIF